MKKIAQFLALSLLASSAYAVDYTNAKVTGVGIFSGEDGIRFTIDRDPNAVFRTTQYTGEQLKRLVALVMTAYTSQAPVFLIRSSESSSSTVRHYTDLTVLSVGSQTYD